MTDVCFIDLVGVRVDSISSKHAETLSSVSHYLDNVYMVTCKFLPVQTPEHYHWGCSTW